MAYAAIVSVSQVVKQIQPHVSNYLLLCRHKQMKSVLDNLVFLQTFLQDFPVGSRFKTAQSDLETQIRDLAYELEDIIESYISASPMTTTTSYKQLQFAFRSCTAKIKSVVGEATKLTNNRVHQENLYTSIASSNKSQSAPNNGSKYTSTVGLDKDLNQIKELVARKDSALQIIPITGMGGIGKTTLARNVFEDPWTLDHFDVHAWVTVSQDYNIQQILAGILSSKEQTTQEEDTDLLIEKVYKMLKGRRFLVVLDDMWHGEAWMKIRRAFPKEYNGCRIILTTRLSEVAAYVDASSTVHRMQFLNEDQSWDLLRDKVFGQEYCPRDLIGLGKKIARNCKGLPLAIVVISGLLKANKMEEVYWKNIAKDVQAAAAAATNDDDHFSGIFSLSYNNLPQHLKPCFLYMSIFPEDYEIPTDTLIKLWVAEGFLKPVIGKSFEEVAQEYLEDLVERTLVMITKEKSVGHKIRTCSIHDVLRELSLKKAMDDRFVQHFRDRYIDRISFPQIVKNQRRMSIHTDNLEILIDNRIKSPTPSVRSLICFRPISRKHLSFVCHFKLLRMVNSFTVETECFPSEIFELVNLRYLEFIYDYNGKCCIPSSISKLENLQTLVVSKGNTGKHDTCELILPSEIWNMRRLRHLVLMRNTVLLECTESDPRTVLENLQTLSEVLNFEFTEKAIDRVPNLKKLRIHYRAFDDRDWSRFHLENLIHLHRLEELTFRFHAGRAPIEQFPVPKNISFPKNLKKITLISSGIPWKRMPVIGSLPNLEVLKLRRDSFVGWKWEPIEGEFVRLRQLEMFNINLKIWKAESRHFPCLEKLYISWCSKLQEVPLSIGDIATLETLAIEYCNKEAEQSVRMIQDEQNKMGNDTLKIKITDTPDKAGAV